MLQRQEKQIKRIVKKACKALKLYSVEVRYNTKDNIYFSASNKTGKGYISIDYVKLLQYVKIKNDFGLWNYFKFNTINKRIKFILYHEVGHYLQYIKYYSFFRREVIKENKVKDNISNSDYRKLKLEKMADKIAVGLINRQGKQ